jgi:hypothetical protein
MAAPLASQAPLTVVRLLARVSRADPVYRDLYLQRARRCRPRCPAPSTFA